MCWFSKYLAVSSSTSCVFHSQGPCWSTTTSSNGGNSGRFIILCVGPHQVDWHAPWPFTASICLLMNFVMWTLRNITLNWLQFSHVPGIILLSSQNYYEVRKHSFKFKLTQLKFVAETLPAEQRDRKVSKSTVLVAKSWTLEFTGVTSITMSSLGLLNISKWRSM